MILVFYISGHGFGHASRDIEVINAVGRRSPSTRIIVRTAASRWLFDLTTTVPHEVHAGETDTGVVQPDSVNHDIPETIRQAADFYGDFDARVSLEVEWLQSLRRAPFGADGIVIAGDIPPLAFAAAARAGVPSYALGNFTWDWIYEAYEEMTRLVPAVLDTIRTAYAHALEAWRLPMHGGFAPFSRVIDVPFIARRSLREPGETRRAFGLPLDRPIALSSFGGYGLRRLPLDRVDCLEDYALVVAEATAGPMPPPGRSVFSLRESDIYGRGFRYEDLVRAADVVLSKPGYGIIAECMANDTALVYTSRGAFREYGVLVEEMPRFLRCTFIDHDALFSGRWREALDRVRALPAPATRPPANGAEVVADRLCSRLTA